MDGDDGRGGVFGAAARLAREFRDRFEVGTVHLHGHLALVACRKGGAAEPGLHTVITPDEDEMRRVLSREVT